MGDLVFMNKRWVSWSLNSMVGPLVFCTVSVRAEVSQVGAGDSCSKIQAQARSTASQQLFPRVGVQALRFPPLGGVEAAGWDPAQRQVQMRAFLDYSPTHALQGKLLLDIADAECLRSRYSRPVLEAIRLSLDQGRRAALKKQVDFLSKHAVLIRQIEQDAEERLSAQVSTIAELTELRLLSLNLKQIQMDAEESMARIQTQDLPETTQKVSPMVRNYEQAAMEVERLRSTIRRVAPYHFLVRAGVATAPASQAWVDWFGVVEFAYNLGGIVQSGAERQYLAARERDLATNAGELGPSARALDRALAASTAAVAKELRLLEKVRMRLEQDEVVLRESATPRQAHALAASYLRRLAIEARIVYLEELAQQRRPWGDSHEH